MSTTPPSTAGKRKAVKPGRSARATSPALEAEATAPLPAEPALTLASTIEVPPARRGTHAGGRKKLFKALPSAPSLIGTAALALAAVGATVSQQSATPMAGSFEKFASQASVLNAASSMGSSDALSGRERAVSRDSRREAKKDAATAELQAEAESRAEERNAALAALAASAERQADQMAQNTWSLPLPAGSYRLTSRFGECSSLWSNCHTGLDFAAPSGTPISSIAAGTVTETGYDGSYGNKTVVTLEDGTEIWYCHQTSITVSVGEQVSSGEVIGTVGSTGNSTGPHLHLEVHPGAGDAVDPVGAAAVNGLRF